MYSGQIAVTADIIKKIRRDATSQFNSGNDDAAKALREEADSLTGLIPEFQKKLDGLKSKALSAQIADTVIDATLEVHPDLQELT